MRALVWQLEFGQVADALRLQAERAPGSFVPGWTDRPEIPFDQVDIWNSFCAMVRIGDTAPSFVVDWVKTHWHAESPEGRAILIDVFLELAAKRREMAPKPSEAPDG